MALETNAGKTEALSLAGIAIGVVIAVMNWPNDLFTLVIGGTIGAMIGILAARYF